MIDRDADAYQLDEISALDSQPIASAARVLALEQLLVKTGSTARPLGNRHALPAGR